MSAGELADTLHYVDPWDELPIGVRAGDFFLETRRSRGGFASIYRARHLETGGEAAVKVLHGALAGKAACTARFRREAELLADVEHPNVVRLLAAGELTRGRPYLAVEWIDGLDLAQELLRRGPFPPHEVGEILAQLCPALAAVHARGIVHRDVKVHNVMLDRRDGRMRVTLVDFGVGRRVEHGGAGEELTLAGEVVGTPLTMAPEQLVGGPIDARTDVYGLGILLFHLLTGRAPFRASSLTEVKELHLFAAPPRLSELAPDLGTLDAIVLRCLEKEPAARYPGALALLDALRALL